MLQLIFHPGRCTTRIAIDELFHPSILIDAARFTSRGSGFRARLPATAFPIIHIHVEEPDSPNGALNYLSTVLFSEDEVMRCSLYLTIYRVRPAWRLCSKILLNLNICKIHNFLKDQNKSNQMTCFSTGEMM